MNAWEATKKIVNLSDEVERLLNLKNQYSEATVRERFDKEIDRCEVEFYELKHKLEDISL